MSWASFFTTLDLHRIYPFLGQALDLLEINVQSGIR